MRVCLIRLLLPASAVLVALTACSGDPTGPSEKISVTVSPDTASLCAPGGSSTGGAVRLRATVFDASRRILTDRKPRWSSSNANVAIVDQDGLVRSKAKGVAVIAATVDDARGTAKITVGSCEFSCPLVYSWDGRDWRLDSGTFGGAIMPALQRTDLDNLDHLTPVNGRLRLSVRNELLETDYIDALDLLAVDHPVGTRVAPDARGRFHVFRQPVGPLSAQDHSGRDVLADVARADGLGWESVVRIRDTDRAEEVRDGLVLRFARPAGSSDVHLLLDGNNTTWAATLLGEWIAARGSGVQAWFDSLTVRPHRAKALGHRIAEQAFLEVAVLTDGGWERQALFWEAGPEISKRQVVHLDLSRVRGDTVVVRLESPPGFWWIDAVTLEPARYEAIRVHRLPGLSARAHDGTDPEEVLATEDRRYLQLETGEWAQLEYLDPPRNPGMARSYLLRSTGWYRVHTPAQGTPNVALLALVENEPGGLSRAATIRLNQAILASTPR